MRLKPKTCHGTLLSVGPAILGSETEGINEVLFNLGTSGEIKKKLKLI